MIFGTIIPPALANHLWQSTLFAAAVALLILALRKNRAQVRYCLWLIASLKFLLPFSLLVAVGSHAQWPVSAPIPHAALSVAVEQIGQPFSASPLVLQPAVPHGPDLLLTIVLAVWLCGFARVLLRWLQSWLRVRAAVRASALLPIDAPIQIVSSPSLLEPGVFGFFRPVLLLPAGITGHLEPSHLKAILAHELCHVRRRDNLAAAVHMVVEALFWFHPLVWWIGLRLVEERELACDEEVLRLGNQPHVYAESILKTCQFYIESPLACVSGVTGSDLKKRIARIMNSGIAARLDLRKKLLLITAAIAALVVPLAIGLLNASQSRAQSQPANNAASSAFEVASVKPVKPGDGRVMLRFQPGGRFVATGITAKFLIQESYNVKDSQISEAPPWLSSERYDIDARPEESVGAALDKLPPEQRHDQLMQMIQSLLTERFKLSLGHTTKELPVYALVVAKNGPKLHESAFKPSGQPLASLPPGQPGGPPPPGGFWMGRGKFTSTGVDLSVFVNALSRAVGRIVLDKTGLPGRYDFTLQWTPDEGQGPTMPGAPKEGGDAAPPESNGPSLFTAIQEQLGLKLESQKASVDVLVIQHVEKPSEN